MPTVRLVRPLVVLAAMLAFPAPASASGPSAMPDASTAPSPAAPDAAFTVRAMHRCTETMNAHATLASDPSVIDVFLEVITRQRDDLDPPTTDELAAWASTHRTEIDRLSAIRDALASLSADDPGQQAAWDVVVGVSDDRIVELERRTQALLLGDWAIIVATFRQVGSPSDTPFEASLEALGLARTDCQFAYAPSLAPDAATAAFIARAAAACTTIAARRSSSDFDAASRVALHALATFLQDGAAALMTDPPDGLDAAHAALIAEWHATARDLGAVDATGAPDDAAWADAITYGSARAAILEARQAALVGGDPEAVEAAFSRRAGGQLVGLDWFALGLDQRSCAAVQA
ncbi:MAG: hypothetical protein KF809_14560 [Chloroflexi bacterium]|nr:hypothetical protein [Chloroflexota bacterium]